MTPRIHTGPLPAFRGPGDGSRAVAIGGGHGLSRTLMALTGVVDHTTAIITAADDGGSSGRLRRDFGVVPPGDLRMALAALARNRPLADLLQYRFQHGELSGHSLGNLVLVALADLNRGDLVAALDQVASLAEVAGRVLPCTTIPVHLHAESDAGMISGQVEVAKATRVRRVWLEPAAPEATPQAIEAIARADLVVLGPGSLYTSLLPNLLVPGIAEAVLEATAPKVLIANLREQPGETEGMVLREHLTAIEEHVPSMRFDGLLLHDGAPPSGPGARLEVLHEDVADLVDHVHAADLLDGEDGHDPEKLGAALEALLRPER